MTVDYEDSEEEDAAVFVNKEDVVEEISAAVEASVVSGRGELKGEEFSFQLKNRDGRVMQTRMNEADGRILFDPMVFDEPGTYTYYIDQVPFEADNLVYDAHRETVTVEVSADQATRKLRARVRYDENGACVSLCRAKRLIYVTTAGGSIISDEYGFGYVKALCSYFYGIGECVRFTAEGLDMPNADIGEILGRTKAEADRYFRN